MKFILSIAFLSCTFLFGQNLKELKKLEPTEEYENIHVLKIAEDSLQSSYVIWVKQGVKMHYHAEHTENILVISGKATMRIGNETMEIKKGDYLNIEKGTHHSVDEVMGRKPLKVLSIQSPKFEGGDRIFVN